MPVAVAVLAALLLAVLVVVVAPALGRGDARRSGDPGPTKPAMTEPRDEILATARAALSAWGRFASTGDVTVLGEHFLKEGPQYRQLLTEAQGIAAAPKGSEYEVVVVDPRVQALSSDRAQVRAQVVWRRPGEADQGKVWMIDLRPKPRGGWALWTVRTAEA
ncbi:MAG: hypothetical protein ACRDZW_02075 [Acidimicrobiales bacterium]